MKLFDRVKGDNFEAQMLELAADLDFVQSVLDLERSKEELNPLPYKVRLTKRWVFP